MEVTRDRKFLHTLQFDATDKENLVGAGRPRKIVAVGKQAIREEVSIKGDISKKNIENVENAKRVEKSKGDSIKKGLRENKKITSRDQGVQTENTGKLEIITDLTSEGASEHYWEILAEKRRLALENALDDNRILLDRITRLQEKNKVYEEMLDESRALVEVLQEMIGEDGSGFSNSLDDSQL